MARNATEKEIAAHKEARAFYDMTGAKNAYRYITTEGKRAGNGANALNYLQKNTGVFNGDGMISEEEVNAMKTRAKENKGFIWHGFISLSEEDSSKIDTPEKCSALVKRVFPSFFKDMKLNFDNIDLMCALHLDRPHHLHIHFLFFEKEPKYKGKDNELYYRRKGKIDKVAIDRMFVRLGLAISDREDNVYKSRDAAIKAMRDMTNVKTAMHETEELKDKIITLAKALPQTGRIAYASKDMADYRGRVEEIVRLLLNRNREARQADKRFYQALEERKCEIANICGKPYLFSDKNVLPDNMDLPKYHNTLDEKNIRIVEDIEEDYKRRQGNLVLKLAKAIKPEIYERQKNRKNKANNVKLKRCLTISRRKVGRAFDLFMRSFGQEIEDLEQEYKNYLREAEEEIRRELAKESEQEEEENYKY